MRLLRDVLEMLAWFGLLGAACALLGVPLALVIALSSLLSFVLGYRLGHRHGLIDARTMGRRAPTWTTTK